MLGWSEEEVVGRPPPMVPEAGRAEFGRAVDSALRGERIRGRELRLRRGDGSILSAETWSGRIGGPDGETIGVGVYLLDVGRRREACRDRELFERNVAGSFEVDRDGELLRANRAFAEILGFDDPGELIGRDVSEFYAAPEDREALWAEIERRGEVTRHELRIRRADGTPRRVLESAALVRRPDRDEPVVLGTIVDVTERREATLRYRALFADSGDAIFVAEADGTILEVNGRAAAWTGWSPEELAGRSVLDLHPEDVHEEATRIRDRVVEEGSVRFELPIRRRDGGRRQGEFSAQRLEVTGRPLLQVVGRDVTERRRREERLRASERRYRALFEHNVAGVFRSRPDGTIVEANPAFARILGWDSPEQVEGTDAGSLFGSAEDRAAYLDRLREEGELVAVELELRKRDGTPVWVLENSVLTEDPETGDPLIQGTLVDITDRRRAEERLEAMAFHDPLTGLGNRRMLADRAPGLLALADRRGRHVGIAYLDLDRFKQVNDRWGHGAGDDVLREVARRLDARSRETDLVARVGGDEFVVLLADLEGPAHAVAAARRMTAAFDEPFEPGEGVRLSLSASAGVAVYPDDGTGLEELLRRADRALHRANERVDGLARYRPAIDVERSDLSGFDARILGSLRREEIVVHYQPIVRLPEGEPVAVEALARWEHPEEGLLEAGSFVPRAERTGVIRAVDRHVLERAVRQLADWGRAGSGPREVAVNLSAASLRDPSLLRWLRGLLGSVDLEEGSRLVAEITETEAMEDPAVTADLLRGFREVGVRVALDDFGSGQSSLAYLAQFPVDQVKLDRRFMRDRGPEREPERLVGAMVEMTRRLGVETVAEGVERPDVLSWLARTGCDRAQGHLFGRPEPPDELARRWGADAG